MASAVNPLTSGASASSNSSSSSSSSNSSSTSSLNSPSEAMFLQLLVAQMQNQDPLNPMDSTQFVSQLAQFSELEQTIGIRSDIESYMSQNGASAASAGSSGTNATNSTNTNGTSSTNQTTL